MADTSLYDMVIDVAMDKLMPIAAALFDAELTQGAPYQQALAGAIKGVEAWYGLYEPIVYNRSYSLKSGIHIDHDGVQIDGRDLKSELVVTNDSPHIGWTSGFYLRGNSEHVRRYRHWRPGGDINAELPQKIEIDIKIPKSVWDKCVQEALVDVGVMLLGGR